MGAITVSKFIAGVAVSSLLPALFLAGTTADAAAVSPIFVDDNPSCQDLGYGGGYKIDPPLSGEYTSPSGARFLLSTDGVYFDWSSPTGYVDAVIAKGGPNANLYAYAPPRYFDTGLHSPINPENNQPYGLSHVEFCFDGPDQDPFKLDVSKTANAEYTRTYEWTITKDVSPDLHELLIGGGSGSSLYTVGVTKAVIDSDFAVAGVITIVNNSPHVVGFDIADLANGTAATVDCGANSVSAGGTRTCTYSASLASPTDGTNVVTVTSLNPDVEGDTGTADYAFGDPTTIVGYPDINVTDTNGQAWATANTASWTYSRDFECSRDPADYTNGFYSYVAANTATITETGQSDDASVTVKCYAPTISKTAAGSYDENHYWDVEKSVDPMSQSGYAGDVLPWTWTVTVDEEVLNENILVQGSITIGNPSPLGMTVTLADVLDDGTVASLDDCTTPLVIAAASSKTCAYSATPADLSATLNTATVTLNGIDFSAQALVEFTADVMNASVILDDDQNPAFPIEIDEGGQYTYDDNHTCSSDAGDYGIDGSYEGSEDNTATIKAGDETLDEASASTRYTCEAGFVKLLKWTDGVVNETKDWQFAVYFGPDGFGGNQVGSTSSTFGDADGVLEFGNPALDPTLGYTICELGVPAGWTSLWEVDVDGDGAYDAIVVPYNPNADDPVPQDLGNRCVDFGADTNIPVTVGTTIMFRVDNTYPGGAPRTPGYWKNWNMCTNGGQADNAIRNGGWQEGYWLLEDVLDPAIGGGITWDDILSDNLVVPILSCEFAVSILDQRSFDTGKKIASDAARTLAMHLLATQLNQGAGACRPAGMLGGSGMTLDELILAAETLLDELDFDGGGNGAYLRPKDADYALALTLAGYLDQYNNGMYCGNGN